MPLTPRDRRTLAIGAGTIVLLLMAGRGIPALLDWSARYQSAGEAGGRELDQLEQLARTHPHILRALEGARARLAASEEALLAGTTHASAGAQLAGILSDAVSVSETHLASVQLQGDTSAMESGMLARVAARASLRGDLTSLALFFHALEEGPTLLVVREFAISEADPNIPSTRVEMLRLDLLVEGLYEPAAPTRAHVRPEEP